MADDTKEPLPFDGIPLLNLDEKSGQPPACRLKAPKTLRDIFTRAREDDNTSAMNRADTQDLLDGGAPWDERELAEAGCAGMTNMNFRGAETTLDRSMAPYYKMVQTPDELVSVKTLYGAEEDRPGWEAIMNEEITRTYRRASWFVFQTSRLIHKFIWDGLGVGHYRDKLDFRYRAAGLGQFYFPRQSFIDESEHEVVVAIDEFGVAGSGGLYNMIRNAPQGEASYNGWNVTAVRKAITKATASTPAYQDWERLADEIKNNDLSVQNTTQKVRCIHGFVQEFDGTITHYICTEQCYTENGNEEDFLYVCKGQYREMRQALVVMAYGLGTNTKTHGLRGLGYKIYPFEQQFNRSMSKAITCSDMASSLMLKSNDENGYSGVGYQTIGNATVLDPEFELVQFTAPDLQRSVMPIVEEMKALRNERTAGYSSDGVFDGDQRKTKAEVVAHLEQNAELSDVEQDFFHIPFERLMGESIRRLTRRTYLPMDPGGREVHDLQLRLVKRGVPLEAFFQLDLGATEVPRAIGGGSASSKTLSLSRMEEKYGRMDDVGRANFDWDSAVDACKSTAAASRYFPKNGVPRTTVDTQIAILQNAQLIQGLEIPVLPSDKHLAHAREHVKPLIQMFEMAEMGQIEWSDAAMQYQGLYAHCVEHVENADGDPATQEEVAALNQMLQKIGEVISNGLKEAERLAQEAAENPEQAEAGAAEAGPSPEQVARVEEARVKLDNMREDAAAKRQIMIEAAQTKNAIADSMAASKIARDRMLAAAKAQMPPPAAKKAAKKAPKK